jgi:hypothetical protein
MALTIQQIGSGSDFDAFVCDSDLVGFFHPREIVRDPVLTLARKRQLLSFWLSDIHAVSGSPALRRAAGVTTSVDELFAALAKLDEMIDLPAIGAGTGAGAAA